MFQRTDKLACRQDWGTDIERPGRVMLHPLAKVCIGMLVTIVVSRRQLVMDILRHRKGCDRQQHQDEAEGHPGSKTGRSRTSLHIRFTYHSKENLVKRVTSSHRQLSGTNGGGEAKQTGASHSLTALTQLRSHPRHDSLPITHNSLAIEGLTNSLCRFPLKISL